MPAIQISLAFIYTFPPVPQLFVCLRNLHKHFESKARSARRTNKKKVYLMRSFASFDCTLGLLEILSLFAFKSGNSYCWPVFLFTFAAISALSALCRLLEDIKIQKTTKRKCIPMLKFFHRYFMKLCLKKCLIVDCKRIIVRERTQIF